MASSVELLKLIIDQQRASLKLQTQQLTVLEKQLWELENPVETRPLSDAEMNKRAIAIENRTAMKAGWKRAVDAGMFHNVQSLVDQCHGPWREKGRTNETIVAAVKKLGKVGSLPWQLFTLEIMKNLHGKGSFWRDDHLDLFDDTAGGCDEIVWDAGSEILKTSEETE